jgi:titin
VLPDKVTELEAVASSSSEIKLTWVAPEETGGFEVDNYSVTYRRKNASPVTMPPITDTELVINSLEADRQYTFTVAARTIVGLGASERLQVTMPMSEPLNFRRVDKSDTHISVDWQPPVGSREVNQRYEVCWAEAGREDRPQCEETSQ